MIVDQEVLWSWALRSCSVLVFWLFVPTMLVLRTRTGQFWTSLALLVLYSWCVEQGYALVTGSFAVHCLIGLIGMARFHSSSATSGRAMFGFAMTLCCFFVVSMFEMGDVRWFGYARLGDLLLRSIAVRDEAHLTSLSIWRQWVISPDTIEVEEHRQAGWGVFGRGLVLGISVAGVEALSHTLHARHMGNLAVISAVSAMPLLGEVRRSAALVAGLDVQPGYVLYPVPANSVEFWLRWNRWYRNALQRTVYSPVVRWARRRLCISATGSHVVALIATFAAVGVQHDFARNMVSYLDDTLLNDSERFSSMIVFSLIAISSLVDLTTRILPPSVRPTTRAIVLVLGFTGVLSAIESLSA